MIVSVNQPAYLPWLGYFDRIARSDVHVVLDHVQFEKNSFVNRNRVRTSQGPAWLTVPVRTSGRFGQLAIVELEIDGRQSWRRKHLTTLEQAYGRAPYFGEHRDYLGRIYGREWRFLAELCSETTRYLLHAFAITTPLVRSSDLKPQGTKGQLILELCQRLQATTYISGPLGRGYLSEPDFAEAGIRLVYHDYQHPSYPQLGDGFLTAMSAVDLLLNVGPCSRSVLLSGGKDTA